MSVRPRAMAMLTGFAARSRLVWCCGAFGLLLTTMGCSPEREAADPRGYAQSSSSMVLRTLWKHSTGPDPVISSMQGAWASDEVVLLGIVVPHESDVVRAFDASSGDLLWERAGETFAVAGSNAVVLRGRTVDCLDSRSGAVRWTRHLDARWERVWAGSAIGEGKVLLAMRGRVTALSLETGEELWTNDEAASEAHQDALIAPLPAASMIAVVSYRAAGPVVGLRSTDGVTLWRYDPPEPVLSLPWVEGEVLLVRTEGRVVALDLTTGKPKWEETIPLAPQGGSAVATLGGRAYVVTGRALVEVDLASGAVLAERELPEPLAIVGPSVLVTLDGMLGIACLRLASKTVQAVFYVYDPKERRIAYASPLYKEAVVSRLAASGRRLFFVTLDEIVAMELVR